MTYKRTKYDTSKRCPYCGKAFVMTRDMYLSYKPNQYNKHRCRNCGKEFLYMNVDSKYAVEHGIDVVKPIENESSADKLYHDILKKDLKIRQKYYDTLLTWEQAIGNELHYLSGPEMITIDLGAPRLSTIDLGNRYIQEVVDHIYADVHKGVLVVKWCDGKTTKVALEDGVDTFDLEAGVNAAIVKKYYKSHHSYQKFITEHTTYVQPKKHKKKK